MGFDEYEKKVEAAMRNRRGQRSLKLGILHLAGIETSAAVLLNRMLSVDTLDVLRKYWPENSS
jgi:hypothetical protein